MLGIEVQDLLVDGDGPGIEAVRAILSRESLDPTVRDYLQMALSEVAAETAPANTGI